MVTQPGIGNQVYRASMRSPNSSGGQANCDAVVRMVKLVHLIDTEYRGMGSWLSG